MAIEGGPLPGPREELEELDERFLLDRERRAMEPDDYLRRAQLLIDMGRYAEAVGNIYIAEAMPTEDPNKEKIELAKTRLREVAPDMADLLAGPDFVELLDEKDPDITSDLAADGPS
jgi:hypothetical protein